MKRAFLLIAILIVPGCASTSVRHQSVVSSSGLYAAIAAIDDTERTLWTTQAITKEQHDALAPDILALLKAGKAANDVIMVVGSPVPQQMQDVVAKLAAIAKRVTNIFPDSPTKSKLQTVIIGAQTAATLLLAFLPQSTTGENHAIEPQLHPAMGTGWTTVGPDRSFRVCWFEERYGIQGHRSRQRAA